MSLSPATAVAFALAGGMPSDARDWLTVDLPVHLGVERRGIIVAVESAQRTERGQELAERARELIVARLRERGAPEDVLARAFAAANQALCEENGVGTASTFDRRVLLGVTAVLLDDQHATLAYVPPGQTLFVQDGLVSAVPDLGSWLPDYKPTSETNLVEAMGFSPLVAPIMARTELRPGDTLIVGSSACGQALAKEVASAGLRVNDLSYLFGHDPDLVLDLFRGVFIRDQIDSAAVAVVGFPPLPAALQVRSLGDVGRRTRARWRAVVTGVRNWLPEPRPVAMPVAASAGTGDHAFNLALPARTRTARHADALPSVLPDGLSVGPSVSRAERLHRARGRLVGVSEWLSPKSAATWRQPSPVRQFGVPGAHGVHLYRGTSTYMGESSWRNNLPRMPFFQALARWGLVALVLAVLILGGLYARQRTLGDTERAQSLMTEVDRHIVAARQLSDPAAIDAELERAQAALDDVREAGGSDEQVAARQQAITRQLDQIRNVIRFTNVTRVGSLPPELLGDSVQLAMTGAGVYAAGGGLFQLQPDARQMVRILEPGQKIEEATVGELYGVAVDVQGLYATDGKFLFRLDNEGEWTATALEEINGLGPWPAGPVGAFGGNFYLLAPAYRNIYKFPPAIEDESSSAPIDWVEDQGRGALDQARDFIIDGNIHVLLANGRVQTFYKGAQTADIAFRLDGGEPLALTEGAATGMLYMAIDDGDSGRIVSFDKEGTTAYELMLPDGFTTGDPAIAPPFEDLRDIAVDEGTGTVYLITGDAVWTATFEVPAKLVEGQE